MLRGFLDQLRILTTERRSLLMTMMLVGSAALSVAVYQRQVLQDLPIAVIDRDNSGLSRTLRRYLDASREVRVVDWAPTSVEQARDALVRGHLAGLVVLPHGMATDLKRGHGTRIVTAVDMSNILVGKSARAGISRAVRTVDAGIRIELMTKLGVSSEEASANALPTATIVDAPFNPSTNYTHYLAAPLLFFLLQIYVLLVTCRALRRQTSRSGRLGAGLAIFALGVGLAASGVQVVLPWAGIEPASSIALAAAVIAAWVATSILFAAAIAAVAPNPFTALEMTVLPGMLSLTLSGITWPTDRFGPILAEVSEALPFTPFIRAMQMLLYRPIALGAVTPELLQLGRQAMALGTILVLAPLLRRLWREARAPRGAEVSS